jgi:molybdate transport system substrate-binding protein
MLNQGSYFLLDDRSHQPLEQAFVILNHAKGNKLAYAMADFLSTSQAESILKQYGFTLPPKK